MTEKGWGEVRGRRQNQWKYINQQGQAQHWRQHSGSTAAAAALAAVAAARSTVAAHCAMAAAQWQQRGGCGGGGSVSGGGAAESPAPSANVPTHTPSKATDVPTYASSSLVEDGGMTAPTASLLSAAMAAPMETSTAVDNAPPLPTMTYPTTTLPPTPPTAMTLFVKLNLI